MICEMTYKRRKNKGDSKALENKRYMIVVLNSDFRGFLHAMSLEHISSNQLNDLASDWGLKSVGFGPAFATSGVLTGLRIPKITMIESSGRFYSSKFAKKSGTIVDSYRTFNVKNIGGTLSVIDYEWDKPIFDKQFEALIEEQRIIQEAEKNKLEHDKTLAENAEEKREIEARNKRVSENKAKQQEQQASEKTKKPGNL